MITFATLLLGLIVGPQPVELLVGESVASVVVLLDGNEIATLEQSPWSLTCDFGPRLEPHELVAIGYDTDGEEVDRATQWVNMPREPAEATIALEGGENGRGVVARLTWESVVDSEPVGVSVAFDGKPLPVPDPRRVELPPFDTDQLHHLRVELDFSDNVSSVVETTFAGAYVDQVSAELTAIPVVVGAKARSPTLADLAARFSINSETLTVVAIEEGPAELLLVRDEVARKDLNRLLRHDRVALRRRARGGGARDRGSARARLPLPQEVRVRFLWPASTRQERSGYSLDVFPPSRVFTARDGGLFWLMTYVRQPFTGSREDRYSDAVAAAGLLAAARNRRRAVVLLVGKDVESRDASQFSLAETRDYLAALGVPLFVWSTSGKPKNRQLAATVADVSSHSKLARAARDLFEAVDSQRIIWLKGTHLPQTIVVEDGSPPLSLVD